MLRTIIKWSWYPALITALAVASLIYQWPIEIVVPALIIILGIGLVVTIINARQKQLELSSIRLRQLADYFYRRFMGDSTLSIFTIIDSLFNIDNPKLWDWARACDMSQRIFNSWCSSFIGRVESDIKARQFAAYLCHYLNEMWSINSNYHDFVEQFCDVAKSVEIPRETIDQYNRFMMEYNAFVRDFQETISELRKVARTGIEPGSARLAQELTKVG